MVAGVVLHQSLWAWAALQAPCSEPLLPFVSRRESVNWAAGSARHIGLDCLFFSVPLLPSSGRCFGTARGGTCATIPNKAARLLRWQVLWHRPGSWHVLPGQTNTEASTATTKLACSIVSLLLTLARSACVACMKVQTTPAQLLSTRTRNRTRSCLRYFTKLNTHCCSCCAPVSPLLLLLLREERREACVLA